MKVKFVYHNKYDVCIKAGEYSFDAMFMAGICFRD